MISKTNSINRDKYRVKDQKQLKVNNRQVNNSTTNTTNHSDRYNFRIHQALKTTFQDQLTTKDQSHSPPTAKIGSGGEEYYQPN